MKTIVQIIPIKNLHKHKAKYIITVCIPTIITKIFFAFYKKNLQLYKKILSHHTIKEKFFSFKYKNGKTRDIFIIKRIEINCKK